MNSRARLIALAVLLSLSASSCKFKPEPEPLPLSVLGTLNLLNENSQFAMYLNFKSMRRTEFWQRNISDSLLNAEKTFGSLLNTFKVSTGASISDGLDELYYSNSWHGENAIVLKGIFDKSNLDTIVVRDSTFTITRSREGIDIYINNENGLYFFFKDNFTICASNYLKQIDRMLEVTDTSKAGILLNEKLLKTIESVVYKESLWMVTNERMFIRGMLMNMAESSSGKDIPESDSLLADTSATDENLKVENLYKAISSLSFSGKMGNELEILIQGMCVSEKASKYLLETLSGLITIAKLTEKEKRNAASSSILNNLELDRYGESVYLGVTVNDANLADFRREMLMSEPTE